MPHAYGVIHEGDGAFGIAFPDFPGCISGGATVEDAILRGSQTLTFHVAGMVEDGDALPHMRTLADLRRDPEFRRDSEGALLVLVPFDPPGRSVRVNVSIEEALLEAIDRAAEAAGQSRSAFLADAAKARIRTAA